MQSTHRTRMPAYQVEALYNHSALSFVLATGATFADLADRLDRLGERHIGTPTAIYPKSCNAGRPASALQPGF
jgi:hypothetical protein